MTYDQAIGSALTGKVEEITSIKYNQVDALSASETCFLLVELGDEIHAPLGNNTLQAITQTAEITTILKVGNSSIDEAKRTCSGTAQKIQDELLKAPSLSGFLVSAGHITGSEQGQVMLGTTKAVYYRFNFEGKYFRGIE